MASLNDKIAGAKLRQYDIYKDGVFLGLSVEDSTSATIAGSYVDLNVDQIAGIVKSTLLGFPIIITTQIYDTSVDFLRSLLEGQANSDSDGVSSVLKFGNIVKESQEFVGEFLLHPHGVDINDKSGDIRLPTGYAKVENLQLVSSKQNYQSVEIMIISQPDLDQPADQVYGLMGDWALASVTPLATIVHSGRSLVAPYKTSTAMSLGVGGVDRFKANVVNGTNSTFTLLINEVAGYLATDVSLVFDTLTSNNYIEVGMLLKTAANEFIFVESVVYASATTGTMTVVRGSCNTVAGALANNDSLQIFGDLAVITVSDAVTLASSDATKVTIGNTYAGIGVANKGVMKSIATGSANITATFNAVVSANLVVTVP